MRNLKRALSMAMASVMLMGMSVVGTSAASVSDFSDVDAINNQEAVAIATGLGIFDGYDDGSFKPEKVVTRAEMAVVIAKILHGADVNPANFAGAGKFTDVPAWAEGYVNLVAALGIIEGYGDGKFGPNDPVTTVQASTMLMKALGYYTSEGDALGADWALTVTSKANALGIYGDKALSMNSGLTREDVAELTFNALFAQRVAFDDVRGLHVKSNDRNVVVTNGTVDEMNTLAQNTFGLYAVEGIVTANGMTDEALAASLKSNEMTTVMFTEDTDLNKDGKKEYAEDETYDFELESGLDMIGHAVKVYYKIEKKAPVVYAAVDQATLVDYITYDSVSTNLAKAANDAGFKKNTILDVVEADYLLNYDWDTKVNMGDPNQNGNQGNLLTEGKLDTLLVISNSANKQVDYVIALDQYLDTVDTYEVKNDEVEIELLDRPDATDMTVAATDVAEGDLVIVTDIGNLGKVHALEKANVVSANITKLIGKTNAGTDVTAVVADGETYKKSPVDGHFVDKNFVEFVDIAKIGETSLVLDQFGKLIGLATEPAAPNYAYVAQYGVRHSTGTLNTTNAYTAHVYFADGTNGIYEIDMDKSEIAAATLNDGQTQNNTQLGTTNWDTADELNGVDNNDATSVHKANTGLKGIYNVKVLANGKVEIDYLSTDVTNAVSQDDAALYKAHSTLIDADTDTNLEYQGNVAKGTTADDVLYQNNDTVYFFVTGSYQDVVNTKAKNTLKVTVTTGIKNVEKFQNDMTAGNLAADTTISDTTNRAIGTGIKEGYADVKLNGKDIITTMLIQGVEAESDHLYYYDEGNYEVDPANGGYTLTYYLYDAETGAAYTVTYDNDGKYFATVADAQTHAATKPDGFYKIGAKDLTTVHVTTGLNGTLGDTTTDYVVNDSASYDEIIENLFSNSVQVGSIFDEDTIIVNLTNADLNTLKKIANTLDPNTNQTHGDIKLSYAIDKNYNVGVLFVTEFTPDGTQAPNQTTPSAYVMNSMSVSNTGVVSVALSANHAANEKFTVTLYTWSQEQAKWAVQSTKTMTDATADQTATDTNVSFALTNGVTYKMAVNGVEFNEFIFDSTNGNSNLAAAN